MEGNNARTINAFDAIMNTQQNRIQVQKKSTSTRPRDTKYSKQSNMTDFVQLNRFQSENSNANFNEKSQLNTQKNDGEEDYEDYESQNLPVSCLPPLDISRQSQVQIPLTDKEEDEILRKARMEIVNKFGYSNVKLNPSENSGLESPLQFQKSTIDKWYYTLGKSFREYQYSIVKTCLSSNTLVALPTGLGKTFVAATVILNYYLWFPKGKIFFLAPTRPLVNQQIECLRQFKLINQEDIFEMTGNYPIPKRKDVYNQKRIFFQTPQTLENDLIDKRYEGQDLALVIFDEAHRATGNYAYVNIVKCFETLGRGYRIIALSATPGNEFEQIQDVINNLCVAKLEIKDEEDPEVKMYVHKKEIIPIKIQSNNIINNALGLIANMLNIGFQFFKKSGLIPEQHQKMIKKPQDIGQGTDYVVRKMLNIQRTQQNADYQFSMSGISEAYDHLKTFSSLLQGKKKIAEQCINNFKDWLYAFETDKTCKKGKIIKSKNQIIESQDFKDLWKLMRMEEYNPSPGETKKQIKKKNKSNDSKMSDNSNENSLDEQSNFLTNSNNTPNIHSNQSNNQNNILSNQSNNQNIMSNPNGGQEENRDIESHPKSGKLVELLVDYFNQQKNISNASKTIVFTQSRNSAQELKRLLNSIDLIDGLGLKMFRSEMFIGQANMDGQGMNQKQQIETISLFKQHKYNILIATCIGEEGLDIGEVDLIICYDSGFSPIRMIQRMGRTGRKRAGKVYVLLMEGKEFAHFNQSQKKHKDLIQLLKGNSCTQSRDEQSSNHNSRGRLMKSRKQFVFYGFNPRIIPSNINPFCRIIQCIDNSNLDNVSQDSSDQEAEGGEDNLQTKKNKSKSLSTEDRKNKRKKKSKDTLIQQGDFNNQQISEEGEDMEDEEEKDETSKKKQKKRKSKSKDENQIEIEVNHKQAKKQKTAKNKNMKEMQLNNSTEKCLEIAEQQIHEVSQYIKQQQQQLYNEFSSAQQQQQEGKQDFQEIQQIKSDSDEELRILSQGVDLQQFSYVKKKSNKKNSSFEEEMPENNKQNQKQQDPRKSVEFGGESKSAKRQEALDRVKELAISVNGKRQQPSQRVTPTPLTQILKPVITSTQHDNTQLNNGLFDPSFKRNDSKQQKSTDSILLNSNKEVNKVAIKTNRKSGGQLQSLQQQQLVQQAQPQQIIINESSEMSNRSLGDNNAFIDREVVFLKKAFPTAIFSAIDQEKLNVMKKRSSNKLNSSDSNNITGELSNSRILENSFQEEIKGQSSFNQAQNQNYKNAATSLSNTNNKNINNNNHMNNNHKLGNQIQQSNSKDKISEFPLTSQYNAINNLNNSMDVLKGNQQLQTNNNNFINQQTIQFIKELEDSDSRRGSSSMNSSYCNSSSSGKKLQQGKLQFINNKLVASPNSKIIASPNSKMITSPNNKNHNNYLSNNGQLITNINNSNKLQNIKIQDNKYSTNNSNISHQQSSSFPQPQLNPSSSFDSNAQNKLLFSNKSSVLDPVKQLNGTQQNYIFYSDSESENDDEDDQEIIQVLQLTQNGQQQQPKNDNQKNSIIPQASNAFYKPNNCLPNNINNNQGKSSKMEIEKDVLATNKPVIPFYSVNKPIFEQSKQTEQNREQSKIISPFEKNLISSGCSGKKTKATENQNSSSEDDSDDEDGSEFIEQLIASQQQQQSVQYSSIQNPSSLLQSNLSKPPTNAFSSSFSYNNNNNNKLPIFSTSIPASFNNNNNMNNNNDNNNNNHNKPFTTLNEMNKFQADKQKEDKIVDNFKGIKEIIDNKNKSLQYVPNTGLKVSTNNNSLSIQKAEDPYLNNIIKSSNNAHQINATTNSIYKQPDNPLKLGQNTTKYATPQQSVTPSFYKQAVTPYENATPSTNNDNQFKQKPHEQFNTFPQKQDANLSKGLAHLSSKPLQSTSNFAAKPSQTPSLYKDATPISNNQTTVNQNSNKFQTQSLQQYKLQDQQMNPQNDLQKGVTHVKSEVLSSQSSAEECKQTVVSSNQGSVEEAPKKRAYEIINDRLRKDMESEFDQKEWEQRNKNKIPEQPKLDPKARFKQKNSKSEKISQPTALNLQENHKSLPTNSINDAINNLANSDKKIISENGGVISSKEPLKKIAMSSDNYLKNCTDKQQIQSNIPQAKKNFYENDSKNQNKFEEIFSLIQQGSDSDEDEEDDEFDNIGKVQATSQMLQQPQQNCDGQLSKFNIQNQSEVRGRYQNSTFRKENPYQKENDNSSLDASKRLRINK